jgi:hypothetical protein
MAHPMVLRAAALLLAGSSLSASALAEKPLSILGAWRFKTEALKPSCVISGDINFIKGAKADAFACRITSREECRRADGSRSFQSVKQSCTAKFSADGTLSVTSKVDQIIDAGPPEAREALMAIEAYRADDFDVRPDGKGELVGLFHSIQKAGVRFWRATGLIS